MPADPVTVPDGWHVDSEGRPVNPRCVDIGERGEHQAACPTCGATGCCPHCDLVP